ncbi:putative 3-ketoacyl-CoA synthase 6 [Iris pallida]|uniref:very-long-chain 3-oxoacyl-CoA synthase n=1 Tax=Iris pallida TaxID=29817 RepID=A0AAX6I7S7_IRIPA|nr:putative 3-ketoacyl-CoA synthase 6 [Iris pallida]
MGSGATPAASTSPAWAAAAASSRSTSRGACSVCTRTPPPSWSAPKSSPPATTAALTSRCRQGVPNCFFRMGGASVLLSNRGTHRSRAKYRLAHVVRTHGGADDEAYRCIHQQEDSDGHVGIFTAGDVLAKVGEAFRSNVTTLGPLVSPMSGQLRLLSSRFGRRFINPEWKPYIPDFRRHLGHFCVHVGGGAVIGAAQRMLQLEDGDVEPARMTLHRFGNTSSSSVWYELDYIESKGRMRRGDRVLQIAYGSGVKCSSAVWRCLQDVEPSGNGAWSDCIDRYPVDLSHVVNPNV